MGISLSFWRSGIQGCFHECWSGFGISRKLRMVTLRPPVWRETYIFLGFVVWHGSSTHWPGCINSFTSYLWNAVKTIQVIVTTKWSFSCEPPAVMSTQYQHAIIQNWSIIVCVVKVIIEARNWSCSSCFSMMTWSLNLLWYFQRCCDYEYYHLLHVYYTIAVK